MLDVEVLLFYSGAREIDILNLYEEIIAYLREKNMNFQIIDVDTCLNKTDYLKIIQTPILRIKMSDGEHRYIGLADGFKQLFINDLQGKSILYRLGFKEGRLLAEKLQVEKNNYEEVEQLLQKKIALKGIYKFKLETYKPKEAYAEVSLISDEMVGEYGKNKTPICFENAAFLSGIFTELFNKEVHAKETQCMTQGYEKCMFKIVEKKETEDEIKERIKKMMK